MDVFILIIGFIIGYGVSLVHKGITIIHKEPEIETDEKGNQKYNESYENLLPEEIRKTMEENRGIYK